jgi:hypothetical protein
MSRQAADANVQEASESEAKEQGEDDMNGQHCSRGAPLDPRLAQNTLGVQYSEAEMHRNRARRGRRMFDSRHRVK